MTSRADRPSKTRWHTQAVMGTLVKRMFCQQLGLDPGRVYHTAVMPCYDKKLEASRPDFNLPGGNPFSTIS